MRILYTYHWCGIRIFSTAQYIPPNSVEGGGGSQPPTKFLVWIPCSITTSKFHNKTAEMKCLETGDSLAHFPLKIVVEKALALVLIGPFDGITNGISFPVISLIVRTCG